MNLTPEQAERAIELIIKKARHMISDSIYTNPYMESPHSLWTILQAHGNVGEHAWIVSLISAIVYKMPMFMKLRQIFGSKEFLQNTNAWISEWKLSADFMDNPAMYLKIASDDDEITSALRIAPVGGETTVEGGKIFIDKMNPRIDEDQIGDVSEDLSAFFEMRFKDEVMADLKKEFK